MSLDCGRSWSTWRPLFHQSGSSVSFQTASGDKKQKCLDFCWVFEDLSPHLKGFSSSYLCGSNLVLAVSTDTEHVPLLWWSLARMINKPKPKHNPHPNFDAMDWILKDRTVCRATVFMWNLFIEETCLLLYIHYSLKIKICSRPLFIILSQSLWKLM